MHLEKISNKDELYILTLHKLKAYMYKSHVVAVSIYPKYYGVKGTSPIYHDKKENKKLISLLDKHCPFFKPINNCIISEIDSLIHVGKFAKARKYVFNLGSFIFDKEINKEEAGLTK